MTIILITFASRHHIDNRGRRQPGQYSTDRLVAEATASGYFDRVIAYDENDLDRRFYKQHKKFITNNPRGYGYWLWKPQLALQTLAGMKGGDILCYIDAGSTISTTPAARRRMADYIRLVQTSPFDNLGFQMNHLPEHCYSKNDLFQFLRVKPNDSNIRDSGQLVGGIWFIKKSPRSKKLLTSWLKTGEHYHLIDDSPSITANHPAFRAHRHDQSIFSIIRKQQGATLLPDETWQEQFDYSFPILATKIKTKVAWWQSLRRVLHHILP